LKEQPESFFNKQNDKIDIPKISLQDKILPLDVLTA